MQLLLGFTTSVIMVVVQAIHLTRGAIEHPNKGCFQDSASQRMLIGPSFTSDEMTPQLCNQWCSDQQYRFSGVEYGRECFCDWTYTAYPGSESEACTMPCAGDPTTTCGGPNALRVYDTYGVEYPTPVNGFPARGWYYYGCLTDTRTNRTVARRTLLSQPLTAASCMAACQAGGFTVSGLEYGNECYCRNAVNGAATYADHFDCRMRCEGAPLEVCGGPDRINVYRW
jgi:hypothetical protein